MTKNRSTSIRIAAVACMFCMLITAAVCGSVAKYTSTASGQDSVSVAKWEFTVEDVNIAQATAQTFSFNLFNTINEEDTTTTESNVSTGLIAPGTGGSFTVDIANKSQVDAKYTLVLEETNTSNVYIQYSLDGTDWDDDFTTINENTDKTKGVDIERETGTTSVTVYWRWCYEGTTTGAHAGQTDDADTLLGIAGQTTAPSVTVLATLTAVQVD